MPKAIGIQGRPMKSRVLLLEEELPRYRVKEPVELRVDTLDRLFDERL